MDFNHTSIDQNFPLTTFRDGQRTAIEKVLTAYEKGKKYFVLEGPTGCGKSVIGITLANHATHAYYLTSTKILQDQLTQDFEKVVDLKGRSNYECTFYQEHGPKYVEKHLLNQKQLDKALTRTYNCNNGYCKEGGRNVCKACVPSNKVELAHLDTDPEMIAQEITCPYYKRIEEAQKAKITLMNFSSFLYQTSYTQRFGERDLLIIDEAHNIEPQLLDFISLVITDEHLKPYGIEFPELKSIDGYIYYFANEIDLGEMLKQLVEFFTESGNLDQADNYKSLLSKYNYFKTTARDTTWIFEFKKSERSNILTFKPIYIRDYVEELLFQFGERILLMSATILNTQIYCGSLGISGSVGYSMTNRIPAKRRPVIIDTVAKMTGGGSKMVEWGPILLKKVEKICAGEHKQHRGIIHTHNFAIANLIRKECSKDLGGRLFFQGDFRSKNDQLRAHRESSNGILIAPAMHEGIDLPDDVSRFQIICKVPYANFYDDKQLAARIENDYRYYQWLTAIKLVQACGRSVRHEADWAITYIIDEAIVKFMESGSHVLPRWWLDAVVEKAVR